MIKKIGIIGNTQKENIGPFSTVLAEKLSAAGFTPLLCSSMRTTIPSLPDAAFTTQHALGEWCDLLVSIGGDGTMLSTSSVALEHHKPVVGLNFGKLGFLAEVDTSTVDTFISDLAAGRYSIEERMVLTARTAQPGSSLLAVNDIVIDKGGWPKMIGISISVNGDFVTTFSADGVIIATPTGSTGYSLSAGGSIISPRADAIAISPISPHSLTMRPLVLTGSDTITLQAISAHTSIQVNCDGQRVQEFTPPLDLIITKSSTALRLLRVAGASYFATLRNKLLWGMDLRNKQDS